MNQIDISVIILTCNRIQRCHDSLKKNQAALAHLNTEWWIINNGPSDFALPENLSAPTQLLQMPENMGTVARNQAEPNGRFVLMLDDDAYIEPETVDAALKEMEEHPTAGGVILPVKGEGCLLQTIFHGCAVLFATPALNIINGYPDHYLYYGEEYDVAFRMAAVNFYMRPTLQGVPPVLHVRDSGGRNLDHIMYRLVRNNTFCWMRCLPAREILPALIDTLYRYYHVSRKENARAGFWRGVRAVPGALWRGWRLRAPMNQEQFEKMAMLDELKEIKPTDGNNRLILCGIGKFMRTTIRTLKKNGWNIVAIAEGNPAFHGRSACGIKIVSKDEALAQQDCAFLTGLIAAPGNQDWTEQLEKQGSSIQVGKLIKLLSRAR